MKISFITIFPKYVEELSNHSIIKNAINKGLLEIEYINPRDFSTENKIDDIVYGGGRGMLLMIEPIVKAINSVKSDISKVFLLGPRGVTFDQKYAKKLSNEKHLILISGHYEGIDSRISKYIDGEISIGNYILSGGELPSLVIADAIIRLIPNVIKDESIKNESFENNLLECDQFTKPVSFNGDKVPDVLLNGDHKKISKWRKENAIEKTIEVLVKKMKGKENGN